MRDKLTISFSPSAVHEVYAQDDAEGDGDDLRAEEASRHRHDDDAGAAAHRDQRGGWRENCFPLKIFFYVKTHLDLVLAIDLL